MLAQGQSSSAKGGGLVADVGSGLIFLKKKKKFPCPVSYLFSEMSYSIRKDLEAIKFTFDL